ncbi:phosphatase PAP2 family protein [Dechloromonas denitrificans]|uniref:phosphatase PAP2 family protein n=1 Tax=Dechloromonas denitrificans TaxID=281362 RepID=UPI001CFBC6C3|nr:phosphatase PAP2 family protein [Dechloromonas denitrificans]UCV09394.1 phosphatase PAP2 family protein [Dechloromonas denitrificans]
MIESPSIANQSPQFQDFLPAWCLLLAVAMGILVWGDGWYAGFFTAQSVSGVLPPWFWGALTTLGDERMLLALLLPFALRFPRVFWTIIVASLLAALIVRGVKLALPMPRPAEVLDAAQITVIGARRTGHGFPSSHAATIFAFAAVWVAQLGWRRGLPILGLGALASFSRVAVGAHWPIDVLAGALVGSLAAWAGLVLARRLSWGLHPKVQWGLVCLAALAVCSLPFDAMGYPESLLFRCALCGFGLAGFWRHYLRPVLQQWSRQPVRRWSRFG